MTYVRYAQFLPPLGVAQYYPRRGAQSQERGMYMLITILVNLLI